ncbi:Hsp70 family protein, partial [Pseudomonas aeruginosa]
MAIYGFDFGTTNSLISVVEGDRCIAYVDEDNGGSPHPSVVCYDGDEVVVGHEAKGRLSSSGLGVIGNVVRSPKTLLGKHSVHVDGVSRSPRQMVADIVRYVTGHARDERPGDYSRAVVTIPVDMNGERRRDLREAFRLAGVTIDQFVHEPLAALYGHLRDLPDFASEIRRLDRQYMLVFDWGGGTLDLTLCQLVDGYLVQITNHGCSHLGGDVIDESIMHEVVRRHCAQHAALEGVDVAADAQKKLLARAERAKIDLSSLSQAQIYVPDYFRINQAGLDPDLVYQLSREVLEEIVSGKLAEGLEMIGSLLGAVGFEASDVSLCLATGGMVNMPLIKTRLLEMFGPQRLCVSDEGQLIISKGAAWIAHDRADLLLAKNIELALARDTRHVAIKAGSVMPREGAIQQAERLNLYCTDPRDGVAKIQLEVPARRHGRHVQASDPRNNLASLSVKVDERSGRLFERVELDMRVDENLILKVEACSTVVNDQDATEIHNLEFGLSLGGLKG